MPLSQQSLREMRADKAGAAGHQISFAHLFVPDTLLTHTINGLLQLFLGGHQ
jgi:hypothetical protein